LALKQIAPLAFVSHRAWNPFHAPDDTREYLHTPDPIKFVNHISNGIDPEIPVHLLNEPSNENVPFLIDWVIAAMDHCGENGPNPQRLLVGNFAADKSWMHNGTGIHLQDHWTR